MPKHPPLFVVLEGLDGAGTTTQTSMLQAYYTKKGLISFPTREPTDGPVGSFIRGVLSGHLESAPEDPPYEPSERELALLFAADRLEHSRTIAAKLEAEISVVCDRYVFSSMAYQTLDPSITPDWVAQINLGCAVPDITIFLDVPVDECLRRVGARNEKPTIYEKRDLLEKIHQNYGLLAPHYRRRFGKLVSVDGSRSEEAVHRSIVQTLGENLGSLD